MFEGSHFNGDVSNWDMGCAERLENMFANGLFAGDVSRWNVKNVSNVAGMFLNAPFDGDLSAWQLSLACFSDARRAYPNRAEASKTMVEAHAFEAPL